MKLTFRQKGTTVEMTVERVFSPQGTFSPDETRQTAPWPVVVVGSEVRAREFIDQAPTFRGGILVSYNRQLAWADDLYLIGVEKPTSWPGLLESTNPVKLVGKNQKIQEFLSGILEGKPELEALRGKAPIRMAGDGRKIIPHLFVFLHEEGEIHLVAFEARPCVPSWKTGFRAYQLKNGQIVWEKHYRK